MTLAGDAAHSMPPDRGPGLNHAINDAYNFVAIVKRIDSGGKGQREILEAYSDEVAERGAKETQLSRETAYLTLNYSRFKDSALMRNGMTRSPEDESSGAEMK